MNPRIAILLPTFNGEKYLAEQLDSLLNQSYKNFIIIIRDDGSTDDTVEVIHTYKAKYPLLIHQLPSAQQNLGASGSFSLLIQYVLDHKPLLGLDSAYMVFCDQDDIWQANKIELEMQCLLVQEKATDTIPVLIHSDLRVVSHARVLLAQSYISYQGLKPERNRFPQLLISNLVTGCTMLINEALARKALPIPTTAIMHDWWLALVATAFGKMVFIDQALVDYRQHESNTIGAREYVRPVSTGKSLAEKLALHNASNPHLDDVALQAKAMLQHYAGQLGYRNKLSLSLSAAMLKRSGISQKILYRIVRRL